jgi:hypothetical protein
MSSPVPRNTDGLKSISHSSSPDMLLACGAMRLGSRSMRVERSEREAHEQVARSQLRIAIGQEYGPALSPARRRGGRVGVG